MAALASTPTVGVKPSPPASQASTKFLRTPRAHGQPLTRQAYGPIGMTVVPPTLIVPLPTPHSVLSPSAEAPARPKKRTIRIGIESEFELAPRYEDDEKKLLSVFVRILADNHNKMVHPRHPRMQNSVHRKPDPSEYLKWCMVEEPSITVAGRRPPPCTKSFPSVLNGDGSAYHS